MRPGKLFDPGRAVAEMMAAVRVRYAGYQERVEQVVGRSVRASPRAKALPGSDKLVPKTTILPNSAPAATGVLKVAVARTAAAANDAVVRILILSS